MSIRLVAIAIVLGLSAPAVAGSFSGRVADASGSPVEGAMVTFGSGDPQQATTVFSGPDGAYRTPELRHGGPYDVRVRRIGWRDLERKGEALSSPAGKLDLVLVAETDPASIAGQLPANRWYGLVLDRIEDPQQREELVRQCTFCHQQGNWSTRMLRPEEQWDKVLALMGRMGAGLSPELRAKVPGIFNAAYDPETAVPALTANMHDPDFAPPPAPEVRQAVIEEWVMGHPASMQHDLMTSPDGFVYSVDMTQDQLYQLDPRVPGGERRAFDVPQGDLPLGGIFGGAGGPTPANANAHVGPHSLQPAPDGSIWVTLALGNQLGRFDPKTETWSTFPLEEGLYPHTLRIDDTGRVWYTIAVSNHLGLYDPASGDHHWIRLPAPTWGQAVASRMLPFFLWLSNYVDLSESAGEGLSAPVPYGIDIAPNGEVWFSQLNANRIGRIDPETFEVELVDTPFTAPRRLRFDSKGQLWIPGFSSGLISRFDPETREFKSWTLPIEPIGTETPYALNVHPADDSVWICGTNSDTLIRFDQTAEAFTVYPLPTRVTYTREIDFDEAGRIWTSNSNMPTWQIEGAVPRVLRLDPKGLAAPTEVAAAR